MKFIGSLKKIDNAKIVMFGAPFDSTASYRPGARFAPEEICKNSYSIETYSPYLDLDLEFDAKFYDDGALELPFGNSNLALNLIEQKTAEIISAHKTPLMLGGEHLVTLGAIRAAAKKYNDLHIVHLDAHADLRDDYLGAKLSHATVIRRVWEIVGDEKIYQMGIRSGDKSEFEFAKNHTNLHKFNLDFTDEICKNLADKPVYLTVDLDVLDPSNLPGTGTPEAGGVTFEELRLSLAKILKLNIVGLDLVELAPNLDPSGASTSLVIKLIREIILQIA